MDLTQDQNISFDEWLKFGYDKGWTSDVFCDTHEGPPLTDEESEEWENGGDPCSFHVKLITLH